MPAGFSQQIDRSSTGLLNTVSDAVCGGIQSPSGLATFSGQAGERVILGPESVRFNPAVGTVYGGCFQYVQIAAAATAANCAIGRLVFWTDYENFIVTPDVTAPLTSAIAGVILNGTLAPALPGNWSFIQTLGKVNVKFKATTTKTTPAIGDLVVVDATPANLADVLADATGITSINLKLWLGCAVLQAPVGGGLTPVELQPRSLVF